MTELHSLHDAKFTEMLNQLPTDLSSDAAANAMKALKLYSETRPPEPEPEPTPDPVPATRWGRFKAGLSKVWDNETTRVTIKAGGAFAGVGVVAWSTIHRDHVLERNALAQANQQPR